MIEEQIEKKLSSWKGKYLGGRGGEGQISFNKFISN
jgi:hypothetical protein